MYALNRLLGPDIGELLAQRRYDQLREALEQRGVLPTRLAVNHALPSPAATPQPASMNAATTTDTPHITASWRSIWRVGSMNWGRNALKKAIVFGFDTATANPRRKCTCRAGRGASPTSPA